MTIAQNCLKGIFINQLKSHQSQRITRCKHTRIFKDNELYKMQVIRAYLTHKKKPPKWGASFDLASDH